MFKNRSKQVFITFFLMVSSNLYGRAPRVQPAVASGLQIVKALYGDLTLQGGVSDATAVLQRSVQNNQLVLPAQTKVTWLGDPAQGRAKSLLIIFKIGNNVYLKLIADAAGDTLSAATAQSAMLLLGQPQQSAQAAAVQQQQVQQVQQAQQVQQQQAQAQQVATAAMLAGAGAVMVQPGTTAQQSSAPSQQQQQFGALQQRRLQQLAR